MKFGAGTPFGFCERISNYFVVQYKAENLVLDSFAREADASVSAFIIYEDVAAGKRAKETCDVLAQRLGLNWKLGMKLFSFMSLRGLQMRREAAAAATNANLVVFSCHHEELPFEVWEWIELFLPRPDRPTALVALLASPSNLTGPSRNLEKYLAIVARRHGMEFFSRAYNPAVNDAVN
jgi:hypothetical protein